MGCQTPKLMTGGSLRDYQIEGVEWLKVMFPTSFLSRINGLL